MAGRNNLSKWVNEIRNGKLTGTADLYFVGSLYLHKYVGINYIGYIRVYEITNHKSPSVHTVQCRYTYRHIFCQSANNLEKHLPTDRPT